MCVVKFLYQASKVRGHVYMCCEVPVPSQQSEGVMYMCVVDIDLASFGKHTNKCTQKSAMVRS
jgi:hypothetical protein